jgi:hypothetical protein
MFFQIITALGKLLKRKIIVMLLAGVVFGPVAILI